MAFMLKIQWNIKGGREAEFKKNQEKLCVVMLEHPGVICYHVDYPSPGVSQWTEIYATDDTFAAHLANDKGKAPLGSLVEACDSIKCQCWGNPNDATKEALAGFGATYESTGKNAFALNPHADKNSRV